MELTVERPATITPRYVKQYLINFGFKVKTAAGSSLPQFCGASGETRGLP